MAEKIMLINAIHEDEVRVAILSDGQLLDCDFERPRRKQLKGDIIFAEIKHIEPSLDAAFVDIGSPTQRHGFLPFKEVTDDYYTSRSAASKAASAEAAQEGNDAPAQQESHHGHPPIKDVLREGQKVMVQIDKDERGKKGAALTTYISLAGCYLVLMPNNPKAGGISRRVEGEDRAQMKDILNELSLPEGMGLIIRTAGVGRNTEELQWDLDILLKQWEMIKAALLDSRPAPYLIHQESDIVIRTIRDYLRPDVAQIIIDDSGFFEKIKKQIELLRPEYSSRVKLYSDTVALFTRYDVEKQIETAFQREVRLPSGGAVVIDHTEALTSIDVNSSRSTGGGDIEETALHTNLEAAQTIATQLRLRDLGGLVVVDFIDMTPQKNQREVERYFYECLKTDKARVQMGRISRFGLLELSRQRLRPSLEESNQVICPRCNGQGLIRSVESLSLSIMRFIEEEAMKPGPVDVQPKIFVYVPIDVATYILNEKRDDILNIDARYRVSVLIIPNPNFETPHYLIERITDPAKLKKRASYQMIEERVIDKTALEKLGEPPAQILVPAVKHEVVAVPQKSKAGLLQRLISSIVGPKAEEKTTMPQRSRSGRGRQGGQDSQQDGQGGQRRNHGNRNRQYQQRRGRSGNTTDNPNANAKYQAADDQEGTSEQQAPRRRNDGQRGRGGRNASYQRGERGERSHEQRGEQRGGEHYRERGERGERGERSSERSHEQRGEHRGSEHYRERGERSSEQPKPSYDHDQTRAPRVSEPRHDHDDYQDLANRQESGQQYDYSQQSGDVSNPSSSTFDVDSDEVNGNTSNPGTPRHGNRRSGGGRGIRQQRRYRGSRPPRQNNDDTSSETSPAPFEQAQTKDES